MNITCPICSTSIEVSKFLVGHKGRCPKCSSKFIIPEDPDGPMEILEKGTIPEGGAEPEPAPQRAAAAPVDPPAATAGPPPAAAAAPRSRAAAPATANAPRTVMPATGGAARAPVRQPMVIKQSSGAFGFMFAIVLAALVGVIVYVAVEKNKDKEVVVEKEEKPKVVKVKTPPRKVDPQPVVVEEPEVESFPVYAKVIQPIIEAKCVSCHGEDKAKGRLAMHTYELLRAGSGNGSILKADDDDETRIELVFRAELPEDDEEHMPPSGKPQLTAEELEILKWWVKEGGFEDTENIDAPDEIREKIENLASL